MDFYVLVYDHWKGEKCCVVDFWKSISEQDTKDKND